MITKFKAPVCCNKYLELKNAFFSGDQYFAFQCKKCGMVWVLKQWDLTV